MSRVPDVIDALVGAWSVNEDLAGVNVVDGPPVTDSGRLDWLYVGFDGDESGTGQAAVVEGDWSGLNAGRQERIDLTVAVICGRGDTDVRGARARAFEIAGVLSASLRLDPSAGLDATQIAIASSTLHQEQTGDGVQARLLLTLTIDTFV